mmetsp:Transcript_21846/g.25123  ORF Transcript_21846/g.25123 Transcript_21846/m.25123 type:complete len:91 (+) Transcript_21846:88-360(+)
MDEKSIEDIKFRMDREYEKVFLRRMEEMKIIKQSKALLNCEHAASKFKTHIDSNMVYPATSFYNQLIKGDRKNRQVITDSLSSANQDMLA